MGMWVDGVACLRRSGWMEVDGERAEAEEERSRRRAKWVPSV